MCPCEGLELVVVKLYIIIAWLVRQFSGWGMLVAITGLKCVVVSDQHKDRVRYGYGKELVSIVERWHCGLINSRELPEIVSKQWKPKNPDLIEEFERCRKKRIASLQSEGVSISKTGLENPGEEFWNRKDLPFYDLPVKVITHVSTKAWKEMTGEVERDKLPGWERRLYLANEVLKQLEAGVSSGVSGEGLLPIDVENMFLEPDTDIPRLMDALLNAVRAGTIAGPFERTKKNSERINSFLSVPKPNGDRRQVGNLSKPGDRSFNKNVDPALARTWPLEQLTAKQFSFKLLSMGKGAWMGKSDLSQAYKCLPVSMQQRMLQNFAFGDRIFTELRLIFGDKYAPMFFDRFHHVILIAFVTLPNGIPRILWDKCIDDVPIVCPEERIEWLRRHFRAYRNVCEKLGVKLSPMDEASKCFEASQEGEVLGVWFNSREMTWHIPERKRCRLIEQLRELVTGQRKYELNECQVLVGKLNDIKQLWQPGKFFMDSFIRFMFILQKRKGCYPTRAVIRDAKVWLAILGDGMLPVLPDWTPPPLEHYKTYSDASGEFINSPGIGILIPAQQGNGPRVGAWEFPRGFLNSVDEKGATCCQKTTCLEVLGMLCTLLLAPELLYGKAVVHVMDNIAACLSWRRGRSKVDSWASTLVRATAHVCAYLDIKLYTEWQARRSDRFTDVVDNLSHDLCGTLNEDELEAYLTETLICFPKPLLAWMKSPRIDVNLGIQLVDWLALKNKSSDVVQ